jgi:hypothetical protein
MNDNPAAKPPIAMPVRAAIIKPNNCKDCKFSYPLGNGKMFECRFNPPNSQLVNQGGSMQPVSYWPPVRPDQECGKYERGILTPNKMI